MAHEELHEPAEKLSPAVQDMHRAIISLMEELEAVDWYQQRIEASADDELKSILRHNRDEEKEHAAMLIEWMRRRDATFDAKLREFLFKDGPIREAAGEGAGASPPERPAMSIGALRRSR